MRDRRRTRPEFFSGPCEAHLSRFQAVSPSRVVEREEEQPCGETAHLYESPHVLCNSVRTDPLSVVPTPSPFRLEAEFIEYRWAEN